MYNGSHTHSHTDGGRPLRAPASSKGAVRVRHLDQGGREAEDPTSNLQVTNQPALAPELLTVMVARRHRLMGRCSLAFPFPFRSFSRLSYFMDRSDSSSHKEINAFLDRSNIKVETFCILVDR